MGEQNSLPQLLSFKHVPLASSVAIAIPEVQVANPCVCTERVVREDPVQRKREKLSVLEKHTSLSQYSM